MRWSGWKAEATSLGPSNALIAFREGIRKILLLSFAVMTVFCLILPVKSVAYGRHKLNPFHNIEVCLLSNYFKTYILSYKFRDGMAPVLRRPH